MSPRTNVRTDEYGGSPRNRLRFLFEVLDAVRARLPRPFILGIKLNSADYIVRPRLS
jgi:2,4-dienoyl-CoA reductase-like NADH-dependent reductase (Old Yellow Enzyme family)